MCGSWYVPAANIQTDTLNSASLPYRSTKNGVEMRQYFMRLMIKTLTYSNRNKPRLPANASMPSSTFYDFITILPAVIPFFINNPKQNHRDAHPAC